MKTHKILYPAVAVLKKNLIDRRPAASIYKVARYASFVIEYPGAPIDQRIYCGDPEQVKEYARKEHLSIIPKNARGRKFFEYTINK